MITEKYSRIVNLSKLKFLIILFSIFVGVQANAQKGTGTAVDFTMTAFGSGDTIHLYDYLESGKVVIIDFFEYECGPCYAYHQWHILNQFYTEHGPDGDNTALVIQMCTFDDADSSKLTGNNGGSWNWLAGIDYPTIIIDPVQKSHVLNSYQAWGTPTIVKICPNKIYSESYPMNSNMSAPAPGYTLTGLDTWMNTTCGVYAGVDAANKELKINCYPNPASTTLHIDGIDNVKSDIRIMNILGEEIIKTSSNRIDVSDLPEGVYFAIVESNKILVTKKFLIKR